MKTFDKYTALKINMSNKYLKKLLKKYNVYIQFELKYSNFINYQTSNKKNISLYIYWLIYVITILKIC